MTTLSRYPVFAQTDGKDKLPPMKDEPNQAEIDAETARRLSEAAQERREQAKPKQYVNVIPDGPLFRWRRQVGFGVAFCSTEAFTTLAAAIDAARVVAACYGVPALVPA